MLAAADPVVTSDGNQVRFEAFSVCCGAYARFDLRSSGIDGDWLGKGTTNVDFNPPMRAALGSIVTSDPVSLRIGADRVEIEKNGQPVVERQVKLPLRWLKGFVEVQVYQSKLQMALEVSGTELLRVIRTLPKQSIIQAGTVNYLTPSGRTLRVSQRDSKDAIAVGAISRLKVLEPILRYAKSVRLYKSEDAVFACELRLNGGSFHLILSPNASRGFSGEGQALLALAQYSDQKLLSSIRGSLRWQDRIVPTVLAAEDGLEASLVEQALQVLGTRGLVGYDLASEAYYHRELPFDLELIEELHPRMNKARELMNSQKVRVVKNDEHDVEAYVQGSKSEHYVRVTDDGARCTCDWHTKNQGSRGPCSHILAAELAIGGDQG